MNAESVHLFLNPTAGRGRAGKRQRRIVELLAGCGLPVELHLSEGVGDLERQVLEVVNAGATRIVVAGGDGSVHETANGLMRAERKAAFGVVPTGTGNDFAKACDIPLDWQQATQALAGRIVAGSATRAIDIG